MTGGKENKLWRTAEVIRKGAFSSGMPKCMRGGGGEEYGETQYVRMGGGASNGVTTRAAYDVCNQGDERRQGDEIKEE